MACEFIGQPLRVCLLESGGLSHGAGNTAAVRRREHRHSLRARYHSEPLFRRQHQLLGRFQPPVRGLPLRPPRVGAESGWPISASDLSPYCHRAHEMCGIEADAYDPQAVLAAIAEEELRPISLPDGRLITHLTRLEQGSALLRQGLSRRNQGSGQRHGLSACQRHRTRTGRRAAASTAAESPRSPATDCRCGQSGSCWPPARSRTPAFCSHPMEPSAAASEIATTRSAAISWNTPATGGGSRRRAGS